MNKGVLRLSFLCMAFFAFARPVSAQAGEFCPARISQVAGVRGTSAAYAVRLAALSQRAVTGQLLIETDRGWFRAPFPPLKIENTGSGIESPPVYIRMPEPLELRNVWLAQGASDDPDWRARGVVACAPDPQRHVPHGAVPEAAPESETVSAAPIAPPIAYGCATPFARARIESSSIKSDDLAAELEGHVAAEVDLDARGAVVDVTALPSSNADLLLRKTFEEYVRHLHFTPAVAYCRAVPSTYTIGADSP